jgi:hypothetical protein
MEPITAFSVARHEGPYETWPLRTKLFVDGRDSGTDIPGYVIEAQYKGRDYYLIVTSWDCVFEESNDFVLLDFDFKELARVQLGAWYNTFLLDQHASTDPDTIELQYAKDLRYRLSVDRDNSVWRRAPRLVLTHIHP